MIEATLDMTEGLKHIMLVEDDADIQEIIRMSLSAIGNYTMDVCSSGQEALDKLQSVRPQLFLLDVAMPQMDGLTLLAKIREKPALSAIPVIFLTAKIQPQDMQTYQKLGVLGVIPKPFDPMSLAERIRELWTCSS